MKAKSKNEALLNQIDDFSRIIDWYFRAVPIRDLVHSKVTGRAKDTAAYRWLIAQTK